MGFYLNYNDEIDINKESWKSILQNKDLLIRIYNKEDYMATTKELTKEEGEYGSTYNSYWHIIFLVL